MQITSANELNVIPLIKETKTMKETQKRLRSIKKRGIKRNFANINKDMKYPYPPGSLNLNTLSSNNNKKSIVPSLPENYLEMQKNIRASNPILWLIRNKNIKDKTLQNLIVTTAQGAVSSKLTTSQNSNIIPNHPLPKLNKPLSPSDVYGNILNYKKGNIIHQGEHSVLYKAFNIETGNVFIVKEYKEDNSAFRKLYYSEVKNFKKLHHINIVNYIGAEVIKSRLYLYLDFVGGCTFREFVNKYGIINEGVLKGYIKQIISLLEYTNLQRLIIGNMSVDHIMIDCDGLLKIVDLSFVKSERRNKKRIIDMSVNYDIKSLGKVLKDIIDLSHTKNFTYSSGLIDYCEFLTVGEMITVRDIKNHPYLK